MRCREMIDTTAKHLQLRNRERVQQFLLIKSDFHFNVHFQKFFQKYSPSNTATSSSTFIPIFQHRTASQSLQQPVFNPNPFRKKFSSAEASGLSREEPKTEGQYSSGSDQDQSRQQFRNILPARNYSKWTLRDFRLDIIPIGEEISERLHPPISTKNRIILTLSVSLLTRSSDCLAGSPIPLMAR